MGWLGDWLRGTLRNWLLLIGAAVAFGYFAGVPHFRASYEYFGRANNPHYQWCSYFGPFGMITSRPGIWVPEDCPFFTLLNWQDARAWAK